MQITCVLQVLQVRATAIESRESCKVRTQSTHVGPKAGAKGRAQETLISMHYSDDCQGPGAGCRVPVAQWRWFVPLSVAVEADIPDRCTKN